MKVTARVANGSGNHDLLVATNGIEQRIAIAAKTGGGSSVNGGELLFAALATCYCNDVYREAAKRGIKVERVEVEVEGEFGAAGEPAHGVRYRASIEADATAEEIRDLLRHTDTVAEIQNSLRAGVAVSYVE